MTKADFARSMLFASTALGLAAAAPAYAAQPTETLPSETQPAEAQPAEAQPAEQPQDSGAGDIVVTARRTEERLQDVPISIVAFSQETLSQRNINTADDLARQTPSLSSNARSGPEASIFTLRGFGQEVATTPSVGVYFADVVGPRAQGGTSGGNGAGIGQFFDLQNVQVLRGPQGTLFGRNTTGGAVLLVPARPTSRFEGYGEVSIGNYDMYRLQAVVNVPLGDMARLRIAVDHQNREGFLRNRSGIGPTDFNDINYISVRAGLIVDLTPDVENYTIVRYVRSDTNGPGQRVIATNTGPNCTAAPGSVGTVARVGPLVCSQQFARQNARGDGMFDIENDIANAFQLIDYWSVINTTTWRVSDNLTLRNIASYQEFTQAQNGNPFGTNLVAPNTVNGVPTPFAGRPFSYVNILTEPGRNNIEQWTATNELQLQGRAFGGRLDYQLGAYYEHAGPLGDYQGSRSAISLSCTDLPNNQCVSPYGPSGFASHSLTRYEFENIGFYAQGTYEIVDGLSFTAGIRYTIDTVDAESAVRNISFPTPNNPSFVCPSNPTADARILSNCRLFGTQRSERPTWLLGLDYNITPDLMVYAKYARGYRQGSTNVSSTLPVAWGPESLDAYEAGVKWTFRGAISGFVNVSGFYNDLSDAQVTASLVPLPGVAASPAQAIVNAGAARIQGVEVDALITPMRGFDITLGYAYLDTELLSLTQPTAPPGYSVRVSAVVGQDLAYSPDHRFVGGMRYTLPLPETVGDVSFGFTYTHTASQQSVYGSPFGRLPAVDLVDYNINWNGIAGSRFDLSLFMTNATDEEYFVAIGNGFATAGYEYGAPAQPRIFGARLRYNFGG